jgi:putative ABC transport system permease protein
VKPDWHAYVRERLRVPELTPEREAHIVREIAAQLDDFYRDAIASGDTEAEAVAFARAQIVDWDRMARDLARADAPHHRSHSDRLIDRLEPAAPRRRGSRHVLADILRDARHGIRQLVRTPAFTAVAILTLAVGIGATTAIFSVVNGVLLRPLPYAEPEQLVRVHEVIPQFGRFSVAPATFLDWQRQNSAFTGMAAYSSGSATIPSSDGAERVPSLLVSAELFDVLGVQPALGRTFSKDEDAPGRGGVALISHGMWQRRFGGAPDVLGRTLTINGRPTQIVGVMPADFYFPVRTIELWMPLGLNPANATRGGHFLGVVARTKPTVTLEQAGAEMKTISERLAEQYPESAKESSETVALLEQVVGGIRPAILTLFAAVGIVVLIACANVANLLLVRATVREKEIAIRTALGAGRGRVALQMLVESVVLAVAGGGLGLLLAYLGVPLIQSLSAGTIPRVDDVTVDTRVLGFVALVSVATGVLFGLFPAWRATRSIVSSSLKEGGRGFASSGGHWVRNTLLVVEVAMSIVLLVGAALLLRSFSRLTSVDPGFDQEKVLAFQVGLPQVKYPQPHQRQAFFEALLERLDALPQIASVGMVQAVPFRSSYTLAFEIQGRPPAAAGEGPSANYRVASPGYFAAMGIPLVRGRGFSDRDATDAPKVAIVDQAFVNRHFPNEDPIGRGIDIGNGTDGFYEIVGVVSDIHQAALSEAPEPTMYVPYRQDVFSQMWILVRTEGDPAALSPLIRQTLQAADPSVAAALMSPLRDVITNSVGQERFSMLLLGLFALIALFLASVGLYGVVAYSVSQRTQEIGVRMAIGAQGRDVMTMIVGGGMKLTLIGVAIGIAGALALARLVSTMLYEVTPFDPISYTVTPLVLLLVAMLACYFPARRAMRIDPLRALRQ